MTKKGLIEMAQFRLAGGNTVADGIGKYHDAMVAVFIARAFEQIMYQIFMKNKSNLDLYAKWFDNVPVVYSNTRSTYTATMPVSVVQFPDAAGIRRIMPDRLLKGSMDSSYVPILIGAEEAYNNLEAGRITSKSGYRLIGKELDLVFHNSNVESLSMLLVVSFDELEDDDTVYLPTGQDVALIDMVTQLMGINKLEDQANNNVAQ